MEMPVRPALQAYHAVRLVPVERIQTLDQPIQKFMKVFRFQKSETRTRKIK